MWPDGLRAGWPLITGVRRGQVARWVGDLDRVGECVAGLSAASERDFLAIGERLAELQRRAREITQAAASFVEKALSAEGGGAVEGLHLVLAEAARLRGAVDEDKRFLSDIRRPVEEVARTIHTLESSVGVFDVLAVLVRIESARGQTAEKGFGSVAEEVRSLAADIRRSAGTVTARIREISAMLAQAARHAGALDSRHARELSEVVEQCEHELGRVNAEQEAMTAGSQTIAKRAEAVSNETAGLVTALQYHDITRQQMEHVGEAANELADRLKQNAGRETLAAVAAVSKVQAAQLRQSRGTLRDKLASIEASLTNLGEYVRETARTAAGETADRCTSDESMQRLYQAFLEINTRLSAYRDNHDEAIAAAEATARRIGELVQAIRDIESVGIRMRRVALNAAVKAAHLGDEGAAIGALVVRVGEFTDEAERHTRSVVEKLESLTAIADGSSAGGDAGSDPEDRTDGRLAGLIEILRSAAGASASQLARIREQSSVLSEELESLRSAFAAGHTSVDGLEELITGLESVSAGTGERAGDALANLSAADLTALEQRYTMQAERDVQRVAVQTSGVSVACSNLEGEELGTNVELF